MNDKMLLGNLTTKKIGNLKTKPIVDPNKKATKMVTGDQEVDYGDLPSRTLTSLGKQVINNETNQI